MRFSIIHIRKMIDNANHSHGDEPLPPEYVEDLAEHIERLERIIVREVASGKRVKLQGTRMFDPEARNQPVDWPDLRDLLQELVGVV